MLGNGDGTFQPPVTDAMPCGSSIVRATSTATAAPTSPQAGGDGIAGQRRRHLRVTGHQRDAVRVLGRHGRLQRRRPHRPGRRQHSDNTVSVLLGNGDGTFQPQVTYAVGRAPDAIVTGDFNGDGRTDLAVDELR